MNEEKAHNFIAYEYKELFTTGERAAMLIDCYASFGWELDPRNDGSGAGNKIMLRRNRKIINKMELTRLQRNFEACMDEIGALNLSITKMASTIALSIGIIGLAFMAGSVFAITAASPLIWLCVACAIPAFGLWILAPLLHRKMVEKRAKEVAELIDEKQEEIYALCEKGSGLL